MGIFGFKIEELNGNGENYIMRGLMICTVQLNCSGVKIEKRKSVNEACSLREDALTWVLVSVYWSKTEQT